jgi:hypothetical protein
MRAFLKAASIGGFVVVCSAFLAAVGSTQTPISSAPAASMAPTDDAAAAADAKADPSCKPAQIACAWSGCYPIDHTKYPSLSSCIVKACNVSDDDCKKQLVQDVYDSDREQAKGGGK